MVLLPSPMFRVPPSLGHHPSTCDPSVLHVLSSHCLSWCLAQAEVQITMWQIPRPITGWKWEPVPPSVCGHSGRPGAAAALFIVANNQK